MDMSTNDHDNSPSTFFAADHRACDALWSDLERKIDGGTATAVLQADWSRFEAAMLRHLAMEEEVLFPAFEDATGMHGGGPTAVMRGEHDQMRQALRQMAGSMEAGELQAVLDCGDMLLMLLQQHNTKEEGILYPMCDNVLVGQWPAIREQFRTAYPPAP